MDIAICVLLIFSAGIVISGVWLVGFAAMDRATRRWR
jgi:hypothetical protein